MEHTVATDIEQLAAEVRQPVEQVRRVMELLDAGFSIAYLARYRCEDTGGIDEELLTRVATAIGTARRLCDRKQVVLRGIAHQNLLTAEIEQAVRGASDLRQLEDIYLPFKRRKRTKEEIEQRELLSSLVSRILAADPDVDVESALSALAAAPDNTYAVDDLRQEFQHILGEHFLQQTAIRDAVRRQFELHTVLTSEQFHEPEAESEEAGHPPDGQDAGTEAADTAEPTPPSPATPSAGANTSEPTAVGHEGMADMSPGGMSRPETDTPGHDATAPEATTPSTPEHTVAPAGEEPTESPAPPAADDAESAESAESAAHVRVAAVVERFRRTALSVAELRREQRRAARQKRRRRLAATFRRFFQFRKTVAKISPSEWTSLDQGERLRVLSIRYDFRWDPLTAACEPFVVPASHPQRDLLKQSLRHGLHREAEVLAREVQRELVARAEARCLDGQCRKLQRLLLRCPLPVPVLAIEPKIRRESTLVVLDAFGKLVKEFALNLAHGDSVENARQQIREVLAAHGIEHVAVGDNPGWKDAIQFLTTLQADQDSSRPIRWTLIRSGGTGLRARGTSAAREMHAQPEHVRRAVSIGRRLQDPLVEYTRLEVERLARLLFSEETKSELFDRRMEHAVRSCVAQSGINVNEAEETLLRYVPGLNPLYAQRLVLARKEAGRFHSRQAILQVPGIDAQALQQAVAFLMVPDSENPFDVTPVHPSHESHAQSLLAAAGISTEQFAAHLQSKCAPGQISADQSAAADWQAALRQVDISSFAAELGIDVHLLSTVREQLLHWSDWTRRQLPRPPMSERPLEWSDVRRLQPVVGTVTNIVPFGAFVDLGQGLVGLLHVSRLSEDFVADPRELIDEGEQLSLWVGDVDQNRQKISLSFVAPRARETTSTRPPHASRSARRSPRPPAGGGRGSQAASRPPRRPKRPPPPVAPLTDDMKDGKEPMRTFSDLLQFYEHQQKGTEPSPRSQDKGGDD